MQTNKQIVIEFESKEQAELIQLIAFRYKFKWFKDESFSFLDKCIKYLPQKSGIIFKKDLQFSTLNYFIQNKDQYVIIPFEEFIKTY